MAQCPLTNARNRAIRALQNRAAMEHSQQITFAGVGDALDATLDSRAYFSSSKTDRSAAIAPTISTTWQPGMSIRFAQTQNGLDTSPEITRQFSTQSARSRRLSLLQDLPDLPSGPSSRQTSSRQDLNPQSAQGKLQAQIQKQDEDLKRERTKATKLQLALDQEQSENTNLEARLLSLLASSTTLESRLKLQDAEIVRLTEESQALIARDVAREAAIKRSVEDKWQAAFLSTQKAHSATEARLKEEHNALDQRAAQVDARFDKLRREEKQQRAADRAAYRERLREATYKYVQNVHLKVEARVAHAKRGYDSRQSKRYDYGAVKDELNSKDMAALQASDHALRKLNVELTKARSSSQLPRKVSVRLGMIQERINIREKCRLLRDIRGHKFHQDRRVLKGVLFPHADSSNSVHSTAREVALLPLEHHLQESELSIQPATARPVNEILRNVASMVGVLKVVEACNNMLHEPSEIIELYLAPRGRRTAEVLQFPRRLRKANLQPPTQELKALWLDFYVGTYAAARKKGQRIVLQKLLNSWSSDDQSRIENILRSRRDGLLQQFEMHMATRLPPLLRYTHKLISQIQADVNPPSVKAGLAGTTSAVPKLLKAKSSRQGHAVRTARSRSRGPKLPMPMFSRNAQYRRRVRRARDRERLARDSTSSAAQPALTGGSSERRTPTTQNSTVNASASTAQTTYKPQANVDQAVSAVPIATRTDSNLSQTDSSRTRNASQRVTARLFSHRLYSSLHGHRLSTPPAESQNLPALLFNDKGSGCESASDWSDEDWNDASDHNLDSTRTLVARKRMSSDAHTNTGFYHQQHDLTTRGKVPEALTGPAVSEGDEQGSTMCVAQSGAHNTTDCTVSKLDYQIPPSVLAEALVAKSQSWTFRLYKSSQGGTVHIYYHSNYESAEKAAAGLLGEAVLGFDLEWEEFSKPGVHDIKRCVSMLQLATESACHLFHIALWKGTSADDLMPASLRQLLSDAECLKAGVNVAGDAGRIQRCFGFEMQGVFELSHTYKLTMFGQAEPEKVNKTLVSLAEQVERMLLLPLPKGEVRTSQWSASKLNMTQLEYAATDAYAGFRLFHALEEKRQQMLPTPPRPACWELRLPIELPDGSLATTKRARKGVTAAVEDEDADEFFDALETQDEAVESAELLRDEAKASPTRLPTEGVKKEVPEAAREKVVRIEGEEVRRANDWIEAWLASRSSTARTTLSAAPLRAYHLWHIQGHSLEDTAGLLRRPPLSTNTVANYVVDAVSRGKLAHDNDRLKEALQRLPHAVKARYNRLIT